MIEPTQRSDPPEITAVLAAFSGDIAIDVGANVGQSALVLAPNFGEVHSFEPAAESLQVLYRMRDDGHLPANTFLWPMAASNTTGSVELVEQARHIGRGQLTSRDLTEEFSPFDEMHGWGQVIGTRAVQSTTLDDWMEPAQFPARSKMLLKIDVEGHERWVLEGARDLIETFGPDLFIEVHSEELGVACVKILASHGYADLTVLHHPYYRPDDAGYVNHFWLTTGEAAA